MLKKHPIHTTVHLWYCHCTSSGGCRSVTMRCCEVWYVREGCGHVYVPVYAAAGADSTASIPVSLQASTQLVDGTVGAELGAVGIPALLRCPGSASNPIGFVWTFCACECVCVSLAAADSRAGMRHACARHAELLQALPAEGGYDPRPTCWVLLQQMLTGRRGG